MNDTSYRRVRLIALAILIPTQIASLVMLLFAGVYQPYGSDSWSTLIHWSQLLSMLVFALCLPIVAYSVNRRKQRTKITLE